LQTCTRAPSMSFSSIPPAHPCATLTTPTSRVPAVQAGTATRAGPAAAGPTPHGPPRRRTADTGTAGPRRTSTALPPQSQAPAATFSDCKDFAKTLAYHRKGLLAWYRYPISTGPLEGTNNKIRALTRQAYGFRDMDYFILQRYALHESRFLLIG